MTSVQTTPQIEMLSDILGYLVVAESEGTQLGHVRHIYLDETSHRVGAIAFRNGRKDDERWVAAEDIVKIGRDVILIRDANAAAELTDDHFPPGRSLEEMFGVLVATADGHHLGRLSDVDIDDDWRISALHVDQKLRVRVSSEQIVMGPHQIVLPAGCAEEVEPVRARPGILSRVVGRERVQSVASGLQHIIERVRHNG